MTDREAIDGGRGGVGPGRGGPPLIAPMAAFAVLTVATAALYAGGRPSDDAATTAATIAGATTLATASALLLTASAAPLAVWTAAASSRLQRLGARVAGPVIALVGGVLASTTLLLSGLSSWVAAQSAASPGGVEVTAALSRLAFALGGPGFVLGMALLLAGVAVPAYILRLVPRGVAVVGVVLAAIGVVGLVGLLVPPLFVLLPVVRFGGLLWLLAMSVLLPVHRRRATPTTD